MISLMSSIESKNIGAKKTDKDIFVNSGLNLIDKDIKKGISAITGSPITLSNNDIIKDIIKVI